jgi:hypothetical protein
MNSTKSYFTSVHNRALHSKIQQTKMLVTCQRFVYLFCHGYLLAAVIYL